MRATTHPPNLLGGPARQVDRTPAEALAQHRDELADRALAATLAKATILTEVLFEAHEHHLDRRGVPRPHQRRGHAVTLLQHLLEVLRDGDKIPPFGTGPGARAAVNVIAGEALKAVGGQAVEADQPAIDARSRMSGAVHVPRQRMGPVASAAQKRPERVEVRGETTISVPVVKIVEHEDPPPALRR